MAKPSGIHEAVNVGSAASSLIRAAKGMAGGPWGAAIGAVIQNGSTLKKAAVGIISLLMLPVLFVVMLPGLVFGNLSDNTGVLNNNTMINENTRAANEAIVEILMESHNDVLAEVNSIATRVPEGDTVQITDPYEDSIYVNATLLISQFCASKDNYEDINITELKKAIQANKDGLFSYDTSTEAITLEVSAEDSTEVMTLEGSMKDGTEDETETISYTQHNYVIKYAGDSYFADHVFYLTDEQKELASQYTENLALFYGSSSMISNSAGEAAKVDLSQRMGWLFPNGIPSSESEVEPYLVTIQVPINNAAGEKTTASLTVHHALAEEITAIFQEIQATGFKIHELSGYGYRKMASGTGSLSHHSYGVAIDINWSENPAVYWGYSPDPSNEYYIDQEIVNIFKAHRFYWGGDWSANYYDPMHFSYTDH